MINRFNRKRGLFVFSDPAGAKVCLALAAELPQENIIVLSDRVYSFFNNFNANVRSHDDMKVSEWFESFQPNYIFTGTSLPVSIELRFIQEAIIRKINSYSFIDHWINMKERFNSFSKYIFPSQVLVIDDHAKKQAISEGIPPEILFIYDNPYYDYLKNWKPSFSRNYFLSILGLPQNAKYILYAPEPISSFNLQEKYGYDELTGLIQLNNSLRKMLLPEVWLIVKGHPNQNPRIFTDFIKNHSGDNIMFLNDYDLNQLIFFSEVVVGYFSNSLIEATKMNKRVIRLLINLYNEEKDPFRNKDIGVIVDNLNNLELELNYLFNR